MLRLRWSASPSGALEHGATIMMMFRKSQKRLQKSMKQQTESQKRQQQQQQQQCHLQPATKLSCCLPLFSSSFFSSSSSAASKLNQRHSAAIFLSLLFQRNSTQTLATGGFTDNLAARASPRPKGANGAAPMERGTSWRRARLLARPTVFGVRRSV